MIIILIGPMGCGKTTVGELLAQRVGWPFADGDDFHPPQNVDKMRQGIPLQDSDRIGWLTSLRRHIDKQIQTESNLVMACSALKKSYREMLGIDQKQVVSVYLKGSAELLKERIAHRTHEYMNESLLKSQLQTMEEPDDGLIVSIDKTPEMICSEVITMLGIRS
ncbi:MAG: gluconokinase [Desulfofustis sp.]|nr:gluconokinase [Desulfofustis sp.]MBT8346467.1 gluconokinase [Desulfofustis sp.]MBT8355894.1 gluconokinase [Desulfofustis sp.]NNF45425.1 gluconokinase [Desulfofustis sp.]NNK13386.1 gluconokinase [Desulfofustis sp.]